MRKKEEMLIADVTLSAVSTEYCQLKSCINVNLTQLYKDNPTSEQEISKRSLRILSIPVVLNPGKLSHVN